MDTYAHGHHHSVLDTHRWRSAENSAAYLLPHLGPGLDLLDVGSGPGTITCDLARVVAPGRVVGIDVEAAVEASRAEATARGVEVDFRLGDAYAIDFPDDTFDVVHAHQVLHHLTDPVAALREMRRVCRPGGLVAVRETDYEGHAWHPQLEGLERWRSTFCAIARANGSEPSAGRRLLSWALEAGLAEVTPSASVWCYATPEDREYWAGTWSTRVTESSYAEHATALGLADEEDLEVMAQAFRDWAASPGGWFVVLHGEVLCRV